MLIFNVDANSHHVANLWCSVPVHVLTASGQRLSLLAGSKFNAKLSASVITVARSQSQHSFLIFGCSARVL